jgi:hypothetical protein
VPKSEKAEEGTVFEEDAWPEEGMHTILVDFSMCTGVSE